ncbi:phosphatidylinositol-specific phospholipase C domain-containing protein [Porphyromonas pogonae]|uniref:phosphatidylinositol-specific phospholipase C domain-containing protein n=1 Tax=Porphyromonas pogonae TaxID=867595 RepID=UPI002E781A82|nr:phosphatidylinositol-specific phospholipase C domain-containing protein [Porphyromonas pogonae]
MKNFNLLRFCAILSVTFSTACTKAELNHDGAPLNGQNSSLVSHVKSGTLHNGNIPTSSWMQLLDDGKTICNLALPSAHDAGASKSGGFMYLTQNSSLKEQLESGVRGFDIRLRAYANKELAIYHGTANQYTDFKRDVLDMMTEYLDTHPTEFILLHVKREGNPTSGSKDYNELMNEIIKSHPQQSRFTTIYSPYQTVGSLRGKLAILFRDNVPGLDNFSYFQLWSDNASFRSFLYSKQGSVSAQVEDEYKVKGVSDSSKWKAIYNHLSASRASNGTSLYVTFLSGTGVFFPPKRVAGNMNRLAVEDLRKNSVPVKGLFFMDFCGSDKGKELTMELIKQNL